MPTRADVAAEDPWMTVLQIEVEGPRVFRRLEDLAIRGDWRTRALALSAIGGLVRNDRTAARPSPLRHLGWHVPAVRHLFPTVGRRGVFVRGPLLNALGDRSWIVRMAAALALGECRDPGVAEPLVPLLKDHHRAVRVAAAAALLASHAPESLDGLMLGGDPAPRRLGDTADARKWIERLLLRHLSVVSALERSPALAGTPRPDLAGWTRLFAGEAPDETPADRSREVQRYASEGENRHNLTKPFAPGPRDQNTRLLHSFLALSEHLDVPQDGRVLDLGGGAGWVSELLARLGYRPVTLDVSTDLLRIARARFAREGLPEARLTIADMSALPFGEGAFDAVVVVDALHHVADVAAVFREAYRVLAPGGQFLLAEPGEGHSETEKSRGEHTEHGVREAEIHVFEAVDWARAAGFDGARIVPHFVPSIYLTPDDLRHALTNPAEAWRIRHAAGGTGRIDEYLLQSVFSHPIIAFGKGERVADSRAPRRLRARLVPELVRTERDVRGVVRINNVGDTVWRRGSDSGCVRLGVQLLTPEKTLIDREFARADLAGDVVPGVTTEVGITLTLPDASAAFALKLDLVDEHICWFEDVGSTPVYVSV